MAATLACLLEVRMHTLDNPTFTTEGMDVVARRAADRLNLADNLGKIVRVVTDSRYEEAREGTLWAVSGTTSNAVTGFMGVFLILKISDLAGFTICNVWQGTRVEPYCTYHDIFGCPFAH